MQEEEKTLLYYFLFCGGWMALIIILYNYNVFDMKHTFDCFFFPNTNATGLSNYDCK